MNFIPSAELIDDISVGITRRLVMADGYLDFYLHTPGGAVSVIGGNLGNQVIQSLSIPGSDQNYFRSIIARLDSLIDLDFREVANASSADVDVYYDQEINLEDSGPGTTLGLCLTDGRDWEIIINYPKLLNDQPLRRYALNHELGHSLGLEHPFRHDDGDVLNGVTDPWLSAYPEETVMAYRSPLHGSWPDFFTSNDVDALIAIWGAEQQRLSDVGEVREGNDFSESFLGGAGGDVIRSFGGNDTLRGALGADTFWAGDGHDWMNGNDGDDDLGGQHGDDVIHGGPGNDRLKGGPGNDVLWGDKGSDFFYLSAGSDVVVDFDFFAGDRVAVITGKDFTIDRVGSEIHVLSNTGLLTLKNIELDGISLDSLVQLV